MAVKKKHPTKANVSAKSKVKAGTKKVVAKKSTAKKAAPAPAKKKAAPAKSKPVVKAPLKKAVAKTAPAKAVKPVVKKAPAPKASAKAIAPVVDAPVVKATAAEASKLVKTGIKTKKQVVTAAPQPVIEVANHPKTKVRTILISQPKPAETDKNPYVELTHKYGLKANFRQFIKIEGLPAKDFRLQRIDILEHQAVILTSRLAVDHYFRMCNEMRITVPETMKYFCINEATAYYLQKYIQYRKRKIFFGHQTIQDLVDVIRKNKEERFLLPVSDVHKEQIVEFLDEISIKYTKAVMYRTVSADLSDIKDLKEYDMLVFFTPAGIRSLKQNFPDFKQNETRIGCFGVAAANELRRLGYRLDVYAPNPKNPSMSGALDEYLKESNKR